MDQQDDVFFHADLLPGELERILDRIRQNLLFHRLSDQPETQWDEAEPVELPSLPRLGEIENHLSELDFLRNSFGGPIPRRPAGIIGFILNIPFRLFGRKQIRFDNEVLILLAAELEVLKAIEVHLRDLSINEQQTLEKLNTLEMAVNRAGQSLTPIEE